MARKITKEQFSNGTNIDGQRIDKALGDIQNRINNVPLTDIKTAYMPYQLCGGFTPTRARFYNPTIGQRNPRIPYILNRQYNLFDCWLPQATMFDSSDPNAVSPSTGQQVFTPPGLPDKKQENPITQKGTLRDTNIYANDNKVFYHQASQIFQTTSPLIIDELSIYLGTNLFFNNKFRTELSGGENAPEWWGYKGNNASLGDFQVLLSVDDDYQSEIIQLRTNEFIKQDFHMWSGHMVNHKSILTTEYVPSTTTYPKFSYQVAGRSEYEMGFNGMSCWFIFKDLSISIPENGRFRLSLILPDYWFSDEYRLSTSWGGTAVTDGDGSQRPDLFELSWSITGKEEIR